MAQDVLMPVITAGGEDGVVTAWLVDEGNRVTAGQLLAEVQAEKVSQEVHAPADGVVARLVGINEPVPQGQPICVLLTEADEVPETAAPPAPIAEPGRVAASPAAKRVARELGVDLAAVAGSGPGGRVTEADVRAAAAGGEGLSTTRSVIARHLRESVHDTAPVTLTTTVDVTGSLPEHITAWIVRTVALVLPGHPALNGTRDGDRFIAGRGVNIGLAVQTDDGLMAPVVRDPAGRSVADLAEEIADLAARARARELTAADFEGGTFSVSNLGVYGVDAFTPIINTPQIAILGVGAVRTVAGFIADGVVARRQLTLSLTFDHAFVDGAPAAAFLADVRARLEQPGGGDEDG